MLNIKNQHAFNYEQFPTCDHCGHISSHILNGLCLICRNLDVEKFAMSLPIKSDSRDNNHDDNTQF